MLTAKGAVKTWISLQLCLYFLFVNIASVNYSDSEYSFNGFNSDDINDYHDTGSVINDSDLDVSSIGSSDVDDGQSDIDISSLESSDNNDDASSQSGIESTVENNNDDGEDLFTYTPV